MTSRYILDGKDFILHIDLNAHIGEWIIYMGIYYEIVGVKYDIDNMEKVYTLSLMGDFTKRINELEDEK